MSLLSYLYYQAYLFQVNSGHSENRGRSNGNFAIQLALIGYAFAVVMVAHFHGLSITEWFAKIWPFGNYGGNRYTNKLNAIAYPLALSAWLCGAFLFRKSKVNDRVFARFVGADMTPRWLRTIIFIYVISSSHLIAIACGFQFYKLGIILAASHLLLNVVIYIIYPP